MLAGGIVTAPARVLCGCAAWCDRPDCSHRGGSGGTCPDCSHWDAFRAGAGLPAYDRAEPDAWADAMARAALEAAEAETGART